MDQRQVSAVVASVALFSQALATPDACATVSCGAHGTCHNGTCVCDTASGYTGTFCGIAPVPVAGNWSSWVDVGNCSVSCGGGLQTRVRTCTPPLYGGAPCVGDAISTVPCNLQSCTQSVNGGWSPWSEWSACDSVCPGNTGGNYAGMHTRTRFCNNPIPTADGAPCAGSGTFTGARWLFSSCCLSIACACVPGWVCVPVIMACLCSLQRRALRYVKRGRPGALEAASAWRRRPTRCPCPLCSAPAMAPACARPLTVGQIPAAVVWHCVSVPPGGTARTAR